MRCFAFRHRCCAVCRVTAPPSLLTCIALLFVNFVVCCSYAKSRGCTFSGCTNLERRYDPTTGELQCFPQLLRTCPANCDCCRVRALIHRPLYMAMWLRTLFFSARLSCSRVNEAHTHAATARAFCSKDVCYTHHFTDTSVRSCRELGTRLCLYNPTQRHQGEHIFESYHSHTHIRVYNRTRRHQVTTFAQAGSTYGTDFVLQYQARDRSNNAARVVTRTVTIVDTTPPVLRRHGDAVFRLEAGDPCVTS